MRKLFAGMSLSERKGALAAAAESWSGPSEPQSHTEHLDALDATLFRKASDPYELVLELESGQLRLRDQAKD